MLMGRNAVLFLCCIVATQLFSIATADDSSSSEFSTYEILLRLFDATRGLRWTDHTGWLQNEDVCTWKGVICYDDEEETLAGHVQLLTLSGNHMVGQLPPEVFALPYLETLELNDNPDLEINLADIVDCPYLEHLQLSETSVAGLKGIGAASNLETLRIVRSRLTGSLPDELFSLTRLTGLFANYNSFSGTLSTKIGLMTQLQQIFFYDSDFVGQLPTELGHLKDVTILTLTDNKFNGTLPIQLGHMSNLQRLAINRIDGEPGIVGTLPKFNNLRHLTELYLQNQLLTGTIPSNFMSKAPKDEIVKIDLSNNLLTGALPTSWSDFYRLRPSLQGNQLTEIADALCEKDWYKANTAPCPDKILCPIGFYAKTLGRATSTDPCVACESAKYLGTTLCTDVAGDETSTASTEKEILEHLYDKMNGEDWKNNDGWLVEDNVCDWHGVDCNADQKVIGLSMKNNGLSGAVPTEIYSLPNLAGLTLNSNDINFSFLGIAKATKLQVLDLTNTNLRSLEGAGELAQTLLIKLKVASNEIKGEIPLSLFSLTSLVEINLSHNQLTGRLPTDVQKWVNLERLSCYGNSLQGPLPTELGVLTGLEWLDLSENDFTGSLPTELEQLTWLKSLSLHQTASAAGLSGEMLAFKDLTKLTSLHLESNQLTGTLPANFLANTERGNTRIELRLTDNKFEGIVPSFWANRFDNLFIDITGNRIVGLTDTWCQKDEWMDGSVNEFDCDAILCPAGTFNEFGRRTGADTSCRSCPQSGNVLGSRECQGQGQVDTDTTSLILKEFYHATGGDSWANRTGWIQSADHCNGWRGVSCNADGDVVNIDLNQNGLMGTMPSNLYKLPALERLSLWGNDEISVTFEGIGQASNLQHLLVMNVNLDSVVGIGKAVSLQELHISENKFTGTIPDELFELTKLTYLNCDANRFSGRLPSGIGNLSNLEDLFLVDNQISGQIPAAIGSLTKLKNLHLTKNRLSGTLPAELEQLRALQMLALERESGVIVMGGDVNPAGSDAAQVRSGIRGPILAFRDMPNLQYLFISENSLTGTVPFEFMNGVTDKGKPLIVDISQNRLEGSLPASLSQFDAMNLLAGGNQITGIAPGLCKKDEWQKGLVADVGCDAILCPPGKYNEQGKQDQDGKGPLLCKDCDVEGAALYFGSMECWSPSEVKASTERDILKAFFDALGGFDWKTNTNWLDESSSICTWFGVTCVSDELASVKSLFLPTNGLNGTVPASIFELEELTEVDFSGNTIHIDFDSVEEVSAVTYLHLDHTGIASLSGIAAAAPDLQLLHIEGNNFPAVPPDVFNLESLDALYMSGNDFSGEFPAQLSLLTKLLFVSCANCGFTGTLPTSIGSLSRLEFFSLYSNNMTGPIPSEIGSLTNMKHLDLSFQTSSGGEGFSGTIPDLSGMQKLTELFLSRNSLTGSIPATLLSGGETNKQINFDFQDNALTGIIPSELSRFPKVQLVLTNNKISGVPSSICEQSWNGGAPSDSGCDHILCGKGFYNDFGFATSSAPCLECVEANRTGYFGSTSCGEDVEQSILSKLYVDLNGQDWTWNDGWLTDNNVCNWYGITCHETGALKGKVQGIVLADNNMVGTVSSDIYTLAHLEALELRKNEVVVPLTGINGAKNLNTLHLSDTLLDTLVGVSAASELLYLHVTECNITGSIPDELFTMEKLEGLYMNYNAFDGSLSTQIGQLTALQELYLFNNKIAGSVPSEIGMLTDLAVLGIGQNMLTGSLPTELGLLSKMEVLSVQLESGLSNGVHGGLDQGLDGPLLPFDNFPLLRELYLGKNSFTGTIPESFLSGVVNVSRVVKVDLTNNRLRGSIPSSLARFSDLRIFLAGNKIDHIPDELCNKSEWMEGLMDSGCDALLCSPGTFSEYGRRVSDREPCQACAFNASSFFYGSQSCSPSEEDKLDERSILFQLYRQLDGDNWKNRDNWLEDNRPICNWHGVHCSTEDNVSADETVKRLELPSNGLRGTIPAVIYHLPALQVLNVRGNDIALSFHGADATTSLTELYLDQTKAGSLDGIGKIEPLKILHLNDNDHGGDSLPNDLFELTNLEILDLSNSGFAGTLPDKLGQLTKLTQLNCHKNDFSGTLPSSLGLLEKLEVFELSENMFYGKLPLEMESMTSLKSLFIDSFLRNGAGISGPLLSFSSMPQLTDLYLGSNTLTGSIPDDFLSGIEATGKVVNVGLNGNSLTGTVPSGLSRFKNLNIDLAGNMFEAIDESLCDKSQWMGGDVETFECAAIMCPLGTFNDAGRQSSHDTPCVPCSGSNVTTYMGSVTCLPLQKSEERQILELLYQVTGGKDWKDQEGWMDDNVDICKWQGISCRADMTVESVRLGSNNLKGKVPKQIFELSNLHFLWLYSNPIEFSFDGIEKAKKLTSLILDSTGLKSLAGIGNAVSLSDVDVRFNSLTAFPEEIRELRELQSLSASHNNIAGTVPLFGTNRKLRTLRLGSNKFTGTVPTFWAHEELASLDLSDNELTGTIPGTLLESLKAGAKPFIDLSSNELTGTVPGEFASRFQELTLFLRDNKLEAIDNEICLSLDYNHGDVHDYSCDGILCPPGKFGPQIGRASANVGECQPCREAEYFGSSTCGGSSAFRSTGLTWSAAVFTMGVMTLLY